MPLYEFVITMHEVAHVEVEADSMDEAVAEAFPNGNWADEEFDLDYSEMTEVTVDGEALEVEDWPDIGKS
jgi:hypothetical protein